MVEGLTWFDEAEIRGTGKEFRQIKIKPRLISGQFGEGLIAEGKIVAEHRQFAILEQAFAMENVPPAQKSFHLPVFA